MWLFTRYGFFSAVCARELVNGRPGAKLDRDAVMVRARCRHHLEALIDRFDALAGHAIAESQGTDYRYRIIVAKAVWCDVMRALGEELDYANFKGEVGKHLPDDRPYSHALHEIWAVHHGMQS